MWLGPISGYMVKNGFDHSSSRGFPAGFGQAVVDPV
ncbi:unnamed protein product, partial [marine sediment metagenome]